MKCDSHISTGFVAGPRNSCVPNGNILAASPGRTILFSPETPLDTKFSDTFTVDPGRCVLIDTYNMPFDKAIYVNRVVKSTTRPISGDSCDPCAMAAAYGTRDVIVFRERMMLGSVNGEPWQLVKTEGGVAIVQMLIVVPGTYELELMDDNMLGDLEVEYMSFSMEQMPVLPSKYFMPSACNNTIATEV